MRSALCVVLLALCFVASECTATVEGSDQLDNAEDAKGASATTTTAAAQIISQDRRDDKDSGDHKLKPDGNHQSEIHRQQKIATTTTTTKNKEQHVDVHTPQTGDDGSSVTDKDSLSVVRNTEERPNPQINNGGQSELAGKADVKTTETTTAQSSGAQVQDPSLTEVKTTTTTAQVQTLSGSRGDKVQGQSTQSKDGATPDLTVQDAAADATTTTTNAPTNTLPKQSKIQQSVNNKDSSSSTSLMLVFAMLATLAVISVAPVW